MNSNQSYCLGGRHYSQTVNKIDKEKVSPKTKKLVKVVKGKCSNCGRNKSQILTKKMARAKIFIKIAKCTHGNRSAMSNSAWSDLKKIVLFQSCMICVIVHSVSSETNNFYA